MIMNDNLFIVDDLNQLPLTYKYFVTLETKNVKEFYLDNIYGRSERHHSRFYPIKLNYKPLSLIVDEQ
jgi:hypothetical protein